MVHSVHANGVESVRTGMMLLHVSVSVARVADSVQSITALSPVKPRRLSNRREAFD